MPDSNISRYYQDVYVLGTLVVHCLIRRTLCSASGRMHSFAGGAISAAVGNWRLVDHPHPHPGLPLGLAGHTCRGPGRGWVRGSKNGTKRSNFNSSKTDLVWLFERRLCPYAPSVSQTRRPTSSRLWALGPEFQKRTTGLTHPQSPAPEPEAAPGLRTMRTREVFLVVACFFCLWGEG